MLCCVVCADLALSILSWCSRSESVSRSGGQLLGDWWQEDRGISLQETVLTSALSLAVREMVSSKLEKISAFSVDSSSGLDDSWKDEDSLLASPLSKVVVKLDTTSFTSFSRSATNRSISFSVKDSRLHSVAWYFLYRCLQR